LEFKFVSYLKSIRAKFLLLSLSVFYDTAFMNRLWADPSLRRTWIGLLGIFITGTAGIISSMDRLLFAATTYPFADAAIFLGLALFLAGCWRGRMSIAFDLNASRETLRSRGTVLCRLSDTKQSSAYIEQLVSNSQAFESENSLKVTECYLVFASEIWFESLAKKGFDLLGELFTHRGIGDMIASKNSMPSM